MADTRIVALKDGAFEHQGVHFRGMAGRDKADAVMLEQGYVPCTPWESGERKYVTDPAAMQAREGRRILDAWVEQWNLRGVHGLPQGQRPTLESLAATGGKYVPPLSPSERLAAMSPEDREAYDAERAEYNRRYVEGRDRPGGER
jgi:hypothetical protein